MEFINEIALSIKELDWIDNSFTRARKMMHKGKYYPALLVGKEYKSMLPKNEFGNFSFIYLDDPQEFEEFTRVVARYTVPISIIVWFSVKDKTFDQIRSELIMQLQSTKLTNSSLLIDKIYEKPENIYKGFNLSEQETQFAMYPYGAIRIDGKVITQEKCCI